jgi:hypothetical protein
MVRQGIRALALGIAGSALLAGSAQAAPISSPVAVQRGCTAKLLTAGTGYVQRTVTAAGLGSVTARLDGGAGDWDVAVFDAVSGRLVAGSSYGGSVEVAEGFVTRGGRSPCRPAASRAAPAAPVSTSTST